VPFYDVPIDLGSMASCETGRNGKPRLESGKIGHLDHMNLKASCLHVLDPPGAAAAIWVFVDDHRR
jgi:hypothetical protein